MVLLDVFAFLYSFFLCLITALLPVFFFQNVNVTRFKPNNVSAKRSYLMRHGLKSTVYLSNTMMMLIPKSA